MVGRSSKILGLLHSDIESLDQCRSSRQELLSASHRPRSPYAAYAIDLIREKKRDQPIAGPCSVALDAMSNLKPSITQRTGCLRLRLSRRV